MIFSISQHDRRIRAPYPTVLLERAFDFAQVGRAVDETRTAGVAALCGYAPRRRQYRRIRPSSRPFSRTSGPGRIGYIALFAVAFSRLLNGRVPLRVRRPFSCREWEIQLGKQLKEDGTKS